MSAVSSLVQIRVAIKGLPPGLMFQGKGLMKVVGEGKTGVHKPPEEEARLRAHWMKVGNKKVLGIPWVMLYRSICKAGANFKWRNKKTMEYILASTISGTQDMFSLGTDQFETFIDFVKIPPKTGAMVEIGRPLLREWSCEFTLYADCEMWNAADMEKIVVDAGKLIGIGANRPSLKGPYGKFTVEKFEVK
jgi:hypothetical protein